MPVTSVLRRGKDAVHITTDEVKEGSEFLCKINWERRFDHMQQHSGTFQTMIFHIKQVFEKALGYV